jgi:hypothetical protein
VFFILFSKGGRKRVTITSMYKYNVNMDNFKPLKSFEIAYLLGLIFADGWIRRDKKGIAFQIIETDFKDIKDLPAKMGKFSLEHRKRKHWKPSTTLTFFDRNFVDFIEPKGIKENSLDKITQIISAELVPLFLRGYFDGDGCWFRAIRFEVAGPYDFDWAWLESFLSQHSISYRVRRYINHKGHKGSSLIVHQRRNVIKLGHLIYKSYPIDKIGLTRKFKDFQKFLELEVKTSQEKTFANIKKHKHSFGIVLKQKDMKYCESGFLTKEAAREAKDNYIKTFYPEKVEDFCYFDRFQFYNNILQHYVKN